eukprot:CAMPEP_0119132266 /NCGR_PEP_ID=MMETSP1310-20130426/11746_1 /TAXON_ID=464262 /ORGANISM="Genus nov. species nov., Strain RCC2339" /LENGTH=439 /DNA_ID=CAMNT_0007122891 /DNA_START=178 /DNA_END=1497 /DNA_ORIENTATION=-
MEKPLLKGAMKDPGSSSSKKKGVSVGFGGGGDDEHVEIIPESAPANKVGKKFFVSDTPIQKTKHSVKTLEESEADPDAVPKGLPYRDWYKRTQSAGIYGDEPWAILKVTVKQARNVPKNSNKKCECFVKGYCGQNKFSTKIAKHKDSPTWEETYEYPVERTFNFKLKLYDNVGKGSRTADTPLGVLKIRLRSMKPSNVHTYDKWFGMKNHASIKDKDKIEIHLSMCLIIRPVVLNVVHSKLFTQPTLLVSAKNPMNMEPATPADNKMAIIKVAERMQAWAQSMEAFVADQEYKIRLLHFSMHLGSHEAYGMINYVSIPRDPNCEAEAIEYICKEYDADGALREVEHADSDSHFDEEIPRELCFESFHTVVNPKEAKKFSKEIKCSVFTYRRRIAAYPTSMADCLVKSNTFMTENAELDFISTDICQSPVSSHVIVFFWN